MDGTDNAGPLTQAELRAWFGFLNAHSCLTRQLDAELEAAHRISLAEFSVLQHLVLSGGHLRMSELADTVLLSPSGISRLVDRTVAEGLIERQTCDADGRGVRATITDRGRLRMAEAEPTHSAALRRLFFDHFSPQEADSLATLLTRLVPACRSRPAGAAPVA